MRRKPQDFAELTKSGMVMGPRTIAFAFASGTRDRNRAGEQMNLRLLFR